MVRRLINRHIKLPKKLSFFLFGARGTGKTTLLKQELNLGSTLILNLLDQDLENELASNSKALYERVLALNASVETVVINEIQKIPRLLDSVHNLMELHQVPQRFVLTGSSARKLKAGAANLLGGRAAVRNLYPFTYQEIENEFDLNTALSFGTLPKIWNSDSNEERKDLLKAYGNIYLKEEIWAEHLIRKLEPFRRFLEVAAQQSGKILNASAIAKDSQNNDKSVLNWFSILEDTLIGFHLESFHTSVRKQLKNSPKFYFFDTGVARALAGHLSLNPTPSTSYYGDLFESFIISQFKTMCEYASNDYKMYFLRTKSNVEIDLVVVRPGKPNAFVEIKSTQNIRHEHTLSLQNFESDFPSGEFFVLSQDKVEKVFGKVRAIHWSKGLEMLLN
jgi:uncharacterized protein